MMIFSIIFAILFINSAYTINKCLKKKTKGDIIWIKINDLNPDKQTEKLKINVLNENTISARFVITKTYNNLDLKLKVLNGILSQNIDVCRESNLNCPLPPGEHIMVLQIKARKLPSLIKKQLSNVNCEISLFGNGEKFPFEPIWCISEKADINLEKI